ncbi:MAG: succinate dehydrogenase assembly factor 2 [Pelagibacteraceae bacterium]|jgi:antitoxin CptB
MSKLELLKNKIKYRSAYRGTKEMDMLLSSFVTSIINDLNETELEKLNDFLKCNDEDIYNFYMNSVPILEFKENKILNLFKNFKV